MANRIKGLTIEIGGDTTKLEQSLKSVNSTIKSTQSQLKDVTRLLKLDPKNTKLDEKYSAEDVLKLTKNIYRVNTGDGQDYKVSAIQKKTQALLDTIGVNLLRKN